MTGIGGSPHARPAFQQARLVSGCASDEVGFLAGKKASFRTGLPKVARCLLADRRPQETAKYSHITVFRCDLVKVDSVGGFFREAMQVWHLLTRGSWEALYQQNPIVTGGGIFPLAKAGRFSRPFPPLIPWSR